MSKHDFFPWRSTSQRFRGIKVISASAFIFLFLAILSTSGCIGLTGASKPASNQSTSSSAAMTVAPASISFGSVAVGSKASQSVTITNKGSADLTISKASSTAAGVTVSGATFPLVIAAGKQSSLNIVFTPKSAGALSGDVTIVSDTSSTSAVSLSGVGMAASAVLTSSTSSLNFGTVAIGKTASLTVTLTNAGNSDITVSKVTVGGATYSTSGVSAGLILTPGQSATLDARFAPVAAGIVSGSISVASNATNSPDTIALSGDGSQTAASHSATLSWSPSTSTVGGYNVYRSQTSGGPYQKLDGSIVAADSFTDSTVQAGGTYFYVITAVGSSGVESADSSQVSATIPTP